MYRTIKELADLAACHNLPLWAVILKNEKQISSLSEEEIFEKLEARFQVMEQSAKKALDQPLPTVGSLIEGITKAQYEYTKKDQSLCGKFINVVMARALSSSEVNASMGKVCAAPTAGACGIIPAVLISLSEEYGISRRKTLEGLLTASGIGAIIMKNATVAGAEGGCQAECGVAAAMASAAAVELMGGTVEMTLNSISFTLMNCMGLVCDPVAGLVQIPCAFRNASQAVNALLSADLALSGMKNFIPPDEAVDAMYQIGKILPPQLRETSMGGIAVTESGKAIGNVLQKSLK